MKLNNKVAIVTGGASGIGKATVELFAKEGAKVVIADFSDTGKKLVEQLQKDGSEAVFIKTDVTKEEDVKRAVNEAVNKFGRLDIMFANAGIANDGNIAELSYEDWQQTIGVNLSGVYLSDKYAVEQMREQGNGGVIVNSGSIHSYVGKEGVSAYAAAKGGVKMLTQTLGITYAKEGIRVNAVCPGYIDTPLLENLPPETKKELVNLHPIGRLGTTEEVAKAVLFLASEDSSFIVGSTMLIDGGYTAQ